MFTKGNWSMVKVVRALMPVLIMLIELDHRVRRMHVCVCLCVYTTCYYIYKLRRNCRAAELGEVLPHFTVNER